jgi:hypothetical protein
MDCGRRQKAKEESRKEEKQKVKAGETFLASYTLAMVASEDGHVLAKGAQCSHGICAVFYLCGREYKRVNGEKERMCLVWVIERGESLLLIF